jgi:hypothetical protein
VPTRRLEVLLPFDLSTREYAAVACAVWAVLNAAGLAGDSSLRPDKRISDAELNASFDADSDYARSNTVFVLCGRDQRALASLLHPARPTRWDGLPGVA